MLVYFVRFLGINLFIGLIFNKLMKEINISSLRKFNIFLTGSCIALMESWICISVSEIFIIMLIICYFIYSFIISKLAQINFVYSLMIMVVCSSISFFLYFISCIIAAVLISLISSRDYNYTNIVVFIIAFFIEAIIFFFIFKMKRLKNGFPFLKNKNTNYYFESFILIICMNALFVYFLMLNYYSIPVKDTVVIFMVFILFLLTILYNSFIIYQRQKLLEKTIKEYQDKLVKKDAQIETAIKEKNSIIKANHEFYHRQKALSLKLDSILNNKNTLFKEEYGEIIDRINTLSTEYNSIIATNEISDILPKCNIPEIDDMFVYIKSECDKSNIEFSLRLTCDVYQLVNNIIPKNKLETLIGDLIRNSIIAINYSSSEAPAIMAVLGIKDNIYEFSVYDSGINFEIDTLLKLGNEPATTHKDSGGTGVGFITTFETLKYCNASLIITEFSDESFNYTKSITIRFDGEHNYTVKTHKVNDFAKSEISRDDIAVLSS